VISDQYVSDVPVGAFLSGGLDSSAIVAAMMATGNPPAQTYCIGYEDSELTEKEGFGDDFYYAEMVSKHLGVSHSQIRVSPPTERDLAELVWTLDEPQADVAPLFVQTICQAAKAEGIKVLMSGAGGDDIFTGYRRHRAAALRAQYRGVLTAATPFAQFIQSGRSAVHRKSRRFLELMKGDDETFIDKAFEFNDPQMVNACLSSAVKKRLECSQGDQNWQSRLVEMPEAPLTERVLRMELFGFLPDHNLNYTDKASMRAGVEVRVPLLDQRLVAFAASIPTREKLRGASEKWILKQAARDRLPPAVLNRKKTGFGGPVRGWVTGAWSPLIDTLLDAEDLDHLFDREAIRSLIQANKARSVDGSYLLFSIYMVQQWIRRFAQ